MWGESMSKRKTATLQSIADDHGVSIATVSRVLNNKGNVSDSLKTIITQTLFENGYEIAIEELESKTIVVFVPDYANPFNVDVLSGIEKAAKLSDYKMVLTRTKTTTSDIDYYLSLIENINAIGIISLSPFDQAETVKKLNSIIPTVMCSDYIFHNDLSFVSIDDDKSAYNATKFLIKSGRKKILHVTSTLNHNYAVLRQRGFLKACNDYNLDVSENDIMYFSTINYDIAYSQLNYYLSVNSDIDGIFASSDIFAAAAIKAALNNNLNIPTDISIVGFDNIDLANIVSPNLTTVNQPRFDLGFQALELVREKIEKNNRIEKQIFLETNLIVRSST